MENHEKKIGIISSQRLVQQLLAEILHNSSYLSSIIDLMQNSHINYKTIK